MHLGPYLSLVLDLSLPEVTLFVCMCVYVCVCMCMCVCVQAASGVQVDDVCILGLPGSQGSAIAVGQGHRSQLIDCYFR